MDEWEYIDRANSNHIYQLKMPDPGRHPAHPCCCKRRVGGQGMPYTDCSGNGFFELLLSASAGIQRMYLNNHSSLLISQASNLVYQCRLSMIAIYGPMTYTAPYT